MIDACKSPIGIKLKKKIEKYDCIFFYEYERNTRRRTSSAYFVSVFRHFEGDIDAGPGRAEYADLLTGKNLRHSVLMAVDAFTAETIDTWNMRNMTDSVMTIAQNQGVKGFRGFYFGL